jgi:hypothetical protein
MTSIPKKNVPYEKEYSNLKFWRTVETWLLYSICALTLAAPILSSNFYDCKLLLNIIQLISYLTIGFYYLVNIVVEVFLLPTTARLRRINFLDNSFGTKLLGKDSQYYFDNDSVSHGPYKMMVNCFENCFFTLKISKAMTLRLSIKNVLFMTFFIVAARFGIINDSVGLPILQIFLSSLFLTELIHHINFIVKLGNLLEKFKETFGDLKDNSPRENDLVNPIRLLLDYESALAYNKSGLSDKVYERVREKLTIEWEELKKYYVIQ